MNKLNENQIENLSGAILTGFEHCHYLEEMVKAKVFAPAALNQVKKTLKHLMFLEESFYNQVEAMDEDNLADKIMSNKLDYVKRHLNKYHNSKYIKFQQIEVAFDLDPVRLAGISDKILQENGAKK